MGRRLIVVDKDKLVNAIQTAENNGALPNLDRLWDVATAIYNQGVVPEKITKAVVALRTKTWSIETKTKPGRRGVTDGTNLAIARASRGEKRERTTDPVILAGWQELRKEIFNISNTLPSGETVYPARRFLPILDRAMKGSRSAAVKLKCIECAGWTTTEVKHCQCTTCALYSFRPYK